MEDSDQCEDTVLCDLNTVDTLVAPELCLLPSTTFDSEPNANDFTDKYNPITVVEDYPEAANIDNLLYDYLDDVEEKKYCFNQRFFNHDQVEQGVIQIELEREYDTPLLYSEPSQSDSGYMINNVYRDAKIQVSKEKFKHIPDKGNARNDFSRIPLIYTKRLDDMPIFKDCNKSLSMKRFNRLISFESIPKYEKRAYLKPLPPKNYSSYLEFVENLGKYYYKNLDTSNLSNEHIGIKTLVDHTVNSNQKMDIDAKKLLFVQGKEKTLARFALFKANELENNTVVKTNTVSNNCSALKISKKRYKTPKLNKIPDKQVIDNLKSNKKQAICTKSKKLSHKQRKARAADVQVCETVDIRNSSEDDTIAVSCYADESTGLDISEPISSTEEKTINLLNKNNVENDDYGIFDVAEIRNNIKDETSTLPNNYDISIDFKVLKTENIRNSIEDDPIKLPDEYKIHETAEFDNFELEKNKSSTEDKTITLFNEYGIEETDNVCVFDLEEIQNNIMVESSTSPNKYDVDETVDLDVFEAKDIQMNTEDITDSDNFEIEKITNVTLDKTKFENKATNKLLKMCKPLSILLHDIKHNLPRSKKWNLNSDKRFKKSRAKKIPSDGKQISMKQNQKPKLPFINSIQPTLIAKAMQYSRPTKTNIVADTYNQKTSSFYCSIYCVDGTNKVIECYKLDKLGNVNEVNKIIKDNNSPHYMKFMDSLPTDVETLKNICCWAKRKKMIDALGIEKSKLSNFINVPHSCTKQCICCCRRKSHSTDHSQIVYSGKIGHTLNQYKKNKSIKIVLPTLSRSLMPAEIQFVETKRPAKSPAASCQIPAATIKTPAATCITPAAFSLTPAAQIKTPAAATTFKTSVATCLTPAETIKTSAVVCKTPAATSLTPVAKTKTTASSFKTTAATYMTPEATYMTAAATYMTSPALSSTPAVTCKSPAVTSLTSVANCKSPAVNSKRGFTNYYPSITPAVTRKSPAETRKSPAETRKSPAVTRKTPAVTCKTTTVIDQKRKVSIKPNITVIPKPVLKKILDKLSATRLSLVNRKIQANTSIRLDKLSEAELIIFYRVLLCVQRKLFTITPVPHDQSNASICNAEPNLEMKDSSTQCNFIPPRGPKRFVSVTSLIKENEHRKRQRQAAPIFMPTPNNFVSNPPLLQSGPSSNNSTDSSDNSNPLLKQFLNSTSITPPFRLSLDQLNRLVTTPTGTLSRNTLYNEVTPPPLVKITNSNSRMLTIEPTSIASSVSSTLPTFVTR